MPFLKSDISHPESGSQNKFFSIKPRTRNRWTTLITWDSCLAEQCSLTALAEKFKWMIPEHQMSIQFLKAGLSRSNTSVFMKSLFSSFHSSQFE